MVALAGSGAFCECDAAVPKSRLDGLYICEQVLFVRFNGNPAPVIRFMQFHYCTVSNLGTGADDAFVLKRSV